MICTPLGLLPPDPFPCGRALESKQLLTGHHNRGSGGVYFSRVLLRFQWTISPSILTFYDHLCSLCIHSWRIHRSLLMTRAPTMVLMCTHSSCPLSQPQASSEPLQSDVLSSGMKQFRDFLHTTRSFRTLQCNKRCKPSPLSAWICKAFT